MFNQTTMATEQPKPNINIAPYMSKFVRCLHVEDDHPVIEIPFSYTQFGVVLMVDIVGFSQMTSIASSKGDVGAEILSSQIGDYFDKAIRVIEYYGGDIFLGDALLVVFQADPSMERLHQTSTNLPDSLLLTADEAAGTLRRNKLTVRRAIECSLELLARLSNYRIYLSEREFARKLSGTLSASDDGNSNEDESNINSNNSTGGFRKREGSASSGSLRPGSITSRTRGGFFAAAKSLFSHTNGGERQDESNTGYSLPGAIGGSEDSHDLQLHMALSAGDICKCLLDSGMYFKRTKAHVAVSLFLAWGESGIDDLLVQDTGRLEYAICGEQMSTIEDALSLAHAGEVTITKSAWQYVNPDAYPLCEPRRNCFILKATHTETALSIPLIRRVRNDKLLNAPVESNPHYSKYVNKSAIHRLILHPDGEYPAQFRNATILFVSLGNVKPWISEGLSFCQRAMIIVHEITSTYEGFIQQFAVDDKGATILCAFGLPYPRSHEKEASFAAKAAWLIRQRFLDADIRGFKISLATGVIFTSTIGNEFRRDPAIVGDTIVIAVRILGFEYAKESIVCDDATMLACTSDYEGLCEFEDMGEEYVKGKLHPIRIWRLVHFGAKRQIHHFDILVDETIGYQPEREKVSKFIAAWSRDPNRNTLVVTGPRGSGKCMFYQQIAHIADQCGFFICSASSLEVEQNTEYFPLKFLLLGMFDLMLKHEIPYSGMKLLEEASSSTAGVHSKNILRNTSIDTTHATFSIDTAMSRATVASDEQHSCSAECSANDHNHRLTADLMLSQFEEPYGGGTASKSTLQALISVCLDKIGSGDVNLTVPVLNNIIISISSDNSMPTISKADDGTLIEFVVRVLNYACQYIKPIVVLEEMQWCDHKTLNVIHAIHQRCPSVLVILFTRSQRDYGGSNIMKTITNHSKHLEVALNGLKPREIEQVLLQAFASKGVNRISPEILELVQERTKGNPLFVKHMSLLLQEFCHVNIVDGELVKTSKETCPNPTSKTLEEILLRQDRKKIVLMQYDRLPPKFQEFLKIASCLDGKFTLAEITAIKPLETLLGVATRGKSYATIISDLDTYRFLSLATDQQTNVQFSHNVVFQTVYTFGSPSTAADIYDSIPYEERVGYHLKMAQYYESFLEQQGYDDIIPQITYHYMKTDHTEKKVKYLQILAAFHLKSNMLTDATWNIEELIHILDTDRGAKEMINDEDLAYIYGMKGECLSKRMRIEEAEPALLDSLARYGIAWPSSKHQWKRELMTEGIKFKYYFLRGLTPVEQKPGRGEHKPRVNSKTQIRLARLIRVLYCLQNIYFWRTEPGAAMLSSLYTLRYARKLGLPSGNQAASLGRIAILNYYQGHKHECQKYMSAALRVSETGECTGGMLPAFVAYIEYCEGRHEFAHQLLHQAISESKTFGVVTHLATFYRAVTMKTAYRMWEGAFNVHPEDCQLLRALSAIAIQNGDSEGETLFAIPTLANLLIQDRFRDAESWVVLIERFIMPKARLMNLLVIHGTLSFYYAKTGDHEKTRIYVELLGQNIQNQGVGAHPFPLMGCMFAVMAMYAIYGSALNDARESKGLYGSSKPQCPFDAGATLNYLVAYLKTEPLKSLAEPFICLAEAIRCFLIQDERGGSLKLEQGFRELGPGLEGITFVKAYFLAQLGRHSSPEQKRERYKEARQLFQSMSM
ncbi:MAG: hypothetical protein J3Q66DRAFT_432623, partial [Benniella sp.]